MGVTEVGGECGCAYGTAVVELNLLMLTGRADLAVPLEDRNFIDERGMLPRLDSSADLRGCDYVSSSFFDYAEALQFQLPDDDGFASPGGPVMTNLLMS